VASLLFIVGGYFKWRAGSIVATEHFDGIDILVIRKPIIAGRALILPGSVGYCYQIEVGAGDDLFTAFTVSWTSQDNYSCHITRVASARSEYDVAFGNDYVVHCKGNFDTMPQAIWTTESQ